MRKKSSYESTVTTVGAIITRIDHHQLQVLLTRRNIEPFKGQWCLPGGHIDRFEGTTEAIKREVKEETGLDFTGQFFDWFDEIFPDLNIHNVVLMFAGTASGSLNQQDAQNEVTAVKWFDLDEAKAQDLAFGHNEVLTAYQLKLAQKN